MKAIDLHEHMRKLGTWVNWEQTTDHCHLGNMETQVKAVAVVWQSRINELKKAVEMGCNLVVTHEQSFYPEPQVARKNEIQQYEEEKRKFAQDTGIVVYRCHDVWDRVPEIGIVHGWGAYLGFGKRLAGDPNATEAVYASPKPTLRELAEYVLGKTKPLGQDSVEMLGDPNAPVTKVAVGCGAGTHLPSMSALGADVMIATNDGLRYWESGSWALDRGTPVVVVDHCVAEEPGLMNLAKYIGEQFGVKSVFMQQGPMYKTVG
ncbi:MAG: Nif3-like dinuclear metal center hexameric protein [Armatimonadota bacterium]|nr:Nif3-like dinuclear metal center hexameric protein [Armatimonadota bacterium]